MFCFVLFCLVFVGSNLQLIKDFNTTGERIVVASACLALLFVVGSFVYYKKKVKGKAGNIQYLAIGKFFLQSSDLFTDIFFNVILYLEDTLPVLTYVSISCLSLSYFGSICICVLWSLRWNAWRAHVAERLHTYLKSYASLSMGLTILSNFYVSIDLLRSKLFYHDAFYFALTKYEYEMLNKYRFVNITLFENVIQLVVQMVYLVKHNISHVNSAIFLSIMFSAFNIFFSLMKYCVNDGQSKNICNCSLEKKFGSKLVIDGDFTIECKQFVSFQAFSHERIAQCLDRFLDKEIDSWIGANESITKDDISLSCEVYHIKNVVRLRNQLKIHFLIQVLHEKSGLRLAKKIYDTISLLIKCDENGSIERYGTVRILGDRRSTTNSAIQLQMASTISPDLNFDVENAPRLAQPHVSRTRSTSLSNDLSISNDGISIHYHDGVVDEAKDWLSETEFLEMIKNALKIKDTESSIRFVKTVNRNENGIKLNPGLSDRYLQEKTMDIRNIFSKIVSVSHDDPHDEINLAENQTDNNKKSATKL